MGTPQDVPEYPSITFIDIETVRGKRLFKDLPERLRDLYIKRFKHEITLDVDLQIDAGKHYHEKAGFSGEFGKVVCISLGSFFKIGTEWKFIIKTLVSRNEKDLLIRLGISLQKAKATRLCAHNGKEFDFPFLFRRYLANGLHVPRILNVTGMKTWDYPFSDTMEIWSHSQWKHKCSMDLMAELCGLPSPKQDMDGSQVGEIFYRMFDDLPKEDLPFDREVEVLKRIGEYCSGDIVTMANLYCIFLEFPLARPEMVSVHVETIVTAQAEPTTDNATETTIQPI